MTQIPDRKHLPPTSGRLQHLPCVGGLPMHDTDGEHDLDYGEIDELDEIGAGERLVLIWCDTHETWEWHWVPLCALPPSYRS